jgi:hypothetical protein
MLLILYLVGYKNNEITINTENNNFTLKNIYNYLEEKGIDSSIYLNIKFIYKGAYINIDYIFTEDSKIYLFTLDETIKEILLHTVFLNANKIITKNVSNNLLLHETILIETDLPLHETDLPEYTLHETVLIETDLPLHETVLIETDLQVNPIFQDSDFITLLKICINRPELLNQVNSYISSGNIVNEIKLLDDINEFKYNKELEIILQLEFIKDNKILLNLVLLKSICQHFEGNINLIIRYLISCDI